MRRDKGERQWYRENDKIGSYRGGRFSQAGFSPAAILRLAQLLISLRQLIAKNGYVWRTEPPIALQPLDHYRGFLHEHIHAASAVPRLLT